VHQRAETEESRSKNREEKPKMRLQEALEASECRGALIEYDDFYTAVEVSFCDGW
jgi:hypothetical protein